MEVSEAIRTRRTHKAFKPEPVDRAVLDELFELARWAPNHNLTNPWRFRVIGPRALERLKEAAGPEAAGKLDRAPTLVVCSCALGGDEIRARSYKRAAVAEAGRQRSAALALEQREVVGRHRGAQAWLFGQPHDRHEWMVLEALADRQGDSRLDA